MNLQLLKRPQPLPRFRDEENGIHAQWRIKGFFYRKTRFPKWSLRGEARVKYASLVVQGRYPRREKHIALVDVGYVEDENDILDVRGCNFRLLLFGVDNISQIRDWLRFLILRQRVPHSLIGKPFEWQADQYDGRTFAFPAALEFGEATVTASELTPLKPQGDREIEKKLYVFFFEEQTTPAVWAESDIQLRKEPFTFFPKRRWRREAPTRGLVQPIKDDQPLQISIFSPLNCFRIW